MEVTSQSYIGISPKLYSFLRHPIQLYPRTHIPNYEPPIHYGAGSLCTRAIHSSGLHSCRPFALSEKSW